MQAGGDHVGGGAKPLAHGLGSILEPELIFMPQMLTNVKFFSNFSHLSYFWDTCLILGRPAGKP
jgi:hypothetical protein